MDNAFEMTNSSRKRYMLLDLSNHMHRCRHGVKPSGNDEDDNDYALHIAISSLLKQFKELKPDKIVAAIDNGSWRKDYLSIYKAGRHAEREFDEGWQKFIQDMADFEDLIQKHSSIICLKHPKVEADDWIGRWIQTHPDADHIIASSDKDFYQMHAPNVRQWHPVKEEFVNIDDPKWELFLKCVRGETAKNSDNIPSAYPKVHTKKLQQAFYGDEFLMETIMKHEVPDVTNEMKKVPVQQLFERNKKLIDLSMQPEEIVTVMDATIEDAEETAGKFEIFYFLQYLGRHELKKIADLVDRYIPMLSL